MPHVMKNFSDITAIDTKRKLVVEVALRKDGQQTSQVTFNGELIEDDQFSFELDLLDPIKLEIKLLEFTEGTSGIEVVYFRVNGINLFPRYRRVTNKDATYIDFYDTWVLDIPSPFYTWYHEISGQGWIA